LRPPSAAAGVDDHRDEGDALGHASCLRIEVSFFESLIHANRGGGIVGGLGEHSRAKPARAGKVKSRWQACFPPGQVDVSRPTGFGAQGALLLAAAVFRQHSLVRSWHQEARFLGLRVEPGVGAKVEAAVANEVVSLGTVATAWASEAMVTVGIDHPVAKGAEVLLLMERDT